MFHLQSDQYRKCSVWIPIPEIEKSHAEMQSVAVNNKVSLMRRKKPKRWTEEEHKLFLEGLKRYGKGAWKSIARNILLSRTPSQIASHAQKYFLRNNDMNPKKRGSIHDITLQGVEGHNTEPPKQQLMGIESDQWVPQHHPIHQLEENMFPHHQQNWVRVPSPTMQQYVDPLSWVSSPALQRPESLPHHVGQLGLVLLPNLQLQGLPNLVTQAHHEDFQMQQQYPHLVDHEENWVPPFEYTQMPQLFNQVPPLEDLDMHGLLRETEQLNTLNNNVVAPNLEAQELSHHIADKERWVLNYMQQLLEEIEKPQTQPQQQQQSPSNSNVILQCCSNENAR